MELSLIGEEVPAGGLAFLGPLSTSVRLTCRPHANDVSIVYMYIVYSMSVNVGVHLTEPGD